MNVLLVSTTGQTDVQLVTPEGRKRFDGDSCGKLHDEMQSRLEDWTIVDAPLEAPSAPRRDAGHDPGNRDQSDRGRGAKVTELPEDRFQVCTPKLDAALGYLVEKELKLTHALILETTRTLTGDSRFAGAILEQRLRERLKIDAYRVSILDGEDLLEDATRPGTRESLIRRSVVERIDNAVRTVIAEFAPDKIVVASTGGVPAVTALVDEIVRLHAGARPHVDLISVPDGGRSKEPQPDRAVSRQAVPEWAESFRARRNALTLVGRGSVVGASGAVSHLSPADLPWTGCLTWLAKFASSLPIPMDCDIEVLRHPLRAVQSAIRTELALRSGDIPGAVHGTVSFFEAALWDHLVTRVERHPPEPRHIRFLSSTDPPDDLVRPPEAEAKPEHRKLPFARMDDNWYRIWDDAACSGKLAKRYLDKDALHKLSIAITREIRDLRNDVAHTIPTPKLMGQAQTRMQMAELWSCENRFLTQPLVQDVLRELDAPSPETLCDDLLAEVRRRLLAPLSPDDPA